jgi:hypothetical protein
MAVVALAGAAGALKIPGGRAVMATAGHSV